MTFPEILQEILKYENCTQTDLAKIINVKPSQISEWLKGKANPGYETLKNMSLALNISTDYLLGLEDDFGARISTVPAEHLVPFDKEYSADEHNLIIQYRRLPEALKELVRQQLDVYSSPEDLLNKSHKKA